MWTLSPSLAIIVATLISIFLIWGRIWFQMPQNPKDHKFYPILFLFQGLFHLCYAFVGLFLIDCGFRLIFSPLLTYGTFLYALDAVVICFAYGIYLIFGTVFLAPTWKTLANFGAISFALLILELLYYKNEKFTYTDLILITLLVGTAAGIFLTIDRKSVV